MRCRNGTRPGNAKYEPLQRYARGTWRWSRPSIFLASSTLPRPAQLTSIWQRTCADSEPQIVNSKPAPVACAAAIRVSNIARAPLCSGIVKQCPHQRMAIDDARLKATAELHGRLAQVSRSRTSDRVRSRRSSTPFSCACDCSLSSSASSWLEQATISLPVLRTATPRRAAYAYSSCRPLTHVRALRVF